MPEPIADALVLVFTHEVSLREWQDTGMLSREWALYRALLPYYKKLVLVTYGGGDDPAVLEPLLAGEERSRISFITNAQKLPTGQYVASLPQRVSAELAGCKSVVVKTNQMAGGDAAIRIADSIQAGRSTALVARGGYLWTRFVSHEHGPHSKQADDAAAREKALCTAADMVVGTTHEMVEDLAWRYGLDPSRTAVIPNYVLVDKDPVPTDAREKGFLLYAGQLIPRKRVGLLIEAVGLIEPEIRKSIRFEVVGDGVQRAELEALAAKLDVPAKFISRIPHEELREKMRRCSMYVQASELEGHPKTILEAMAAGTVVVAAEAPGMEVIRHGLSGLRLAAEPRIFAHAITEVLADADWCQAIGSAAATAVRHTYALETVLPLEVASHRRALAAATRGSRSTAAA